MPDHKDDSFRDMKPKDKIATIVGVALLIMLVVGFIFGVYFFGMAGIFELLGVQYTSSWSLVIFVVSFFILGSILEWFFKAIFKLTIRNIIGKVQVFFIRIGFEWISNWLVLFIVDEFMKSVELTSETEIIIALLFALLEMVFDSDDKGKGSNME